MSTSIISILCGLGGMLGWGAYDFLGGVYSKQIGPFRSIYWSQLAGTFSIIALLLVFTGHFNIPFMFFFLIPLAAMVYSAGYLFFSGDSRSAMCRLSPPP